MQSKFIRAAAVAAVLLVCPQLRADFSITAVHTDLGAPNAITTGGNGTIAPAYQMIRFYAENLGASAAVENQGTHLNSVNITMTDMGAGSLVIGGYNEPSGFPAAGDAADLFGQHEVSVVGGAYQYKQTLTTTTNAPKYVSFVNMLGDASVSSDNNPNQIFNVVGPTPANTYSNYGYGIKSFSVVYGSTNGVGVNATTANGGLGALFAVAVVPFADSVNVQGQFGGDPIGPAPVPTNFNFTTSVVPGDANLNGTVDINDYNTVVRNFGTGTTWTQGDFSGGAAVSINDYNTVVRNFGHSSQSALPDFATAAAVPEPAVAGASLGLLLTTCLGRRRKA
jgi:hypothetical protein